MPTEVHPIGTFPKTEANPDPLVKGKSLEELQELIEWPSKMQEALEAQEVAAPTPEPEPIEPVPAESIPAPEPVQEAAPAAEPEKPAEPSQEDIEKELLRAQIEAIEAHSKKLEAKLTGREAGERGFIKQLQDRIRRLEGGEQAEPSPEPEYRAPSAAEIVPADTRDGFRAWAVQKASQEAVTNFMQSHSDIQGMEPDVVKYLQETGFDARNITQLDDPITAGREMTRVLEETYWHLKETRTRARVAELETRKADQVRGLEEAKRRAAPSASGAPPAPPAPKRDLKDLSLSELEAKMSALRSSGGR